MLLQAPGSLKHKINYICSSTKQFYPKEKIMLPLWVNRTNECSVLGLKRAKEKEKEKNRWEGEREIENLFIFKKELPKK